jgi:hypothetical protein
MNTSPNIYEALIEYKQRDMLAEARQARLAREAKQANRAARDAVPALRTPRPVARRRWRLGLAGLFGAN